MERRGFLGKCVAGLMALWGWKPGRAQSVNERTVQRLREFSDGWPQRVYGLSFKRSPFSGMIVANVRLERSVFGHHLDPQTTRIRYELHVREERIYSGQIDVAADDFQSLDIILPEMPIARCPNDICLAMSSRA